MNMTFDADKYPGKPKVLFIGSGISSHTHSWISLLDKADLNVRLFALPDGVPPKDWPIKTYITFYIHEKLNSRTRHRFLPMGLLGRILFMWNTIAKKLQLPMPYGVDKSLADVIRNWKPDIIHTLGIFDNQGGLFYWDVRRKFHLEKIGKWVVQTRGGSDMTLRRHDPEIIPILRDVLSKCDQIISDNRANIQYAQELGIPTSKFAGIVPIPGTGGVDVDELSKGRTKPSQRERIIVWTKAYDCPWSVALPVFEAIQMAWEQIRPCTIHMFVMITDGTKMWYKALPAEIRQNCPVYDRVPRKDLLALMSRARVLLAPSLVDGVPNSLYEAMATGTFPIVSPLDTIVPVVENEQNVLFARNLYPQEIADALVRAMNDDGLVDQAAQNNLRLVRQIADRASIGPKVVDFYQKLAQTE